MIANLLRIQTPDIRVFMVAGLAAMTFAIMREFAVVTVLPMLLLVPFLSPFRVSPFELTVPITASQVFTARLVTSLLAMMTPIAVWIVRSFTVSAPGANMLTASSRSRSTVWRGGQFCGCLW